MQADGQPRAGDTGAARAANLPPLRARNGGRKRGEFRPLSGSLMVNLRQPVASLSGKGNSASASFSPRTCHPDLPRNTARLHVSLPRGAQLHHYKLPHLMVAAWAVCHPYILLQSLAGIRRSLKCPLRMCQAEGAGKLYFTVRRALFSHYKSRMLTCRAPLGREKGSDLRGPLALKIKSGDQR